LRAGIHRTAQGYLSVDIAAEIAALTVEKTVRLPRK
jgi:hypothetical protein